MLAGFHYVVEINELLACCPLLHHLTSPSIRPAGGTGRGLLGPGRAGDDVALQELHPANDGAECVCSLPGGAAVRPHHQAGDERTEGPVEDDSIPLKRLLTSIPTPLPLPLLLFLSVTSHPAQCQQPLLPLSSLESPF